MKISSKSRANRKYCVDEHFFEKINRWEKAYLLGFIASDGFVRLRGNGNGSLIFNLKREDKKHLLKIKNIISSDHPIIDHESYLDSTNKKYPMSRLEIGSIKIVYDLSKLGVHPRKSFTVKPCKDVPKNLLSAYYLGVFDGDGHFCISEYSSGLYRHILGLTGNEHIVNGFHNFICDNINTKVGVIKRIRENRMPIYGVAYSRLADVKSIIKLLYCDSSVCLDRKKEKADKILCAELKYNDWSSITEKQLNSLYEQYGTWYGVARSLEMPVSTISYVRKRLKMY